MKKIILSRKGFDSSAGGVGSPIFENGTLVSIPIPSKSPSPHKYQDLLINNISGKDLLKEASAKSVTLDSFCHYDPLLTNDVGIFGQASSSQTELKKQQINVGDLFLFFGWFKQFSKKGKNLHHLFGWLQIDNVIEGNDNIVRYLDNLGILHPHGYGDVERYTNNTIYIGKKSLTYESKIFEKKGYGLFKKSHKDLILTEENSTRSKWKLPQNYFSNTNNLFLNRLKWKDEKNCLVDCLGYGQEFILNAEENPNIVKWALELINNYG